MINYNLVAKALEFYKAHGFQHIEVPWIVVPEADDATRPAASSPLSLVDGLRLPGSGEQGFIQLMMKGKLPNGKYVTITPCFRQEPEHNQYTRLWFLKVELCKVGTPNTAVEFMELAKKFLSAEGLLLRTVETEQGWDLEALRSQNSISGVEVGSYGSRRLGSLDWTYGTGLAEPRTSAVLEAMKTSILEP